MTSWWGWLSTQCERCWSEEEVLVAESGPSLCNSCRASRPQDPLLLESLFLPFASKKELLTHYEVRGGEEALMRWAEDQGLSLGEATRRLIDEPSAMTLFGREAVLKIRPRGRAVPYGYRERGGVLSPLPPEARVIVDLFHMYDEGMSLRQIAASLNGRELPTSRGGRWQASTIRHILRNPLYIGRVRRKGMVRREGPPALIEDDLFQRVQKRLSTQAKRRETGIPKASSPPSV